MSRHTSSQIKFYIYAFILLSFLLFPTLIFSNKISKDFELTVEEKLWLKEHPVIKLAPDPEFQPVEFFDANNKYKGIGADYIKLITSKTGIKFKVVRCKNWDDVIKRIKNREVDVLNAVVKTPQREEYLSFPSPYLKIPSAIIVRNTVKEDITLNELKGMRVVMVSGYGYVDLIRNKYPEIEIELVHNLKTALRKVSFGMADAFVGDLATASFYIESEKITNLRMSGESDPANISGFAVRSDWPEFAGILEKAQKLITDEEKMQIQKKWIYLKSSTGVSFEQLQQLIVVTVIIILIIISGFILWNLTLKKMVTKKTIELTNEIVSRKKTEKELSEREAYLKTLIETIPDLVWLKDPNGVYLSCNRKFELFFGAKEKDIIGKTDFDFVEKELAEFFREKDKVAMEAGKPSVNEESVTYASDGHTEILETIKTPMYDKHEKLIGILGIARDITRRKTAEEENMKLEMRLLQSHKMEAIGTLAGGIAHDFNNILSSIIGNVDLLMDDIPFESESYRSLNNISKSADRAKELVNQILAFSRQSKAEKKPVILQKLIKDGLKMLRSSLPATIKIKESLNSDDRVVLADPTQVQQILMNLCTNAYHAMEENGGTLTVTLGIEDVKEKNNDAYSKISFGEYVILSVSDTGIGIPPKLINKLFEPYFTTKEVGKGTGMGLAIIHGIIEEYGGTITVKSIVGEGSTFKVYFPVVKADITYNSKSEKIIERGNERILFIDDESLIIEIAERMFGDLGYQVTVETNSSVALERFKNNSNAFDLIITDQTMPGMTGVELANELLKIRKDIPIILCTGYSNAIDKEKVLSLGIKAFINKPYRKAEISHIIREVLV